jgi:ubiquinone/menaquinone biosynthesis C-methylase UbiE
MTPSRIIQYFSWTTFFLKNYWQKPTWKDKKVVDIGCGTGRYWEELSRQNIAELIGYEASTEMLNKVRQKYPTAKTYLHSDNTLKELDDASCDAIVSTLVIAHIRNLPAEWREWNRVLKNKGEIILTDFHPVALQRGANRSFMHNGQLIYIKNYIHTLDKVRSLAAKMNWKEVGFIEYRIDERVKHFFERLDVMEAYKDSFDQLVLYGIHFRKEE